MTIAVSDSFISKVIADTRLYADEPSWNAKYTDATIMSFLQSVWPRIISEINRNNSAPIIINANITVNDGDEFKILPPTIGQILRIVSFNSQKVIDCDITPRSGWNVAGPGFTIEANCLKFQPIYSGASRTYTVQFIPNGTATFHSGTLGTITNNTTSKYATVVLASSPTLGTLDNRPSAYVGSMLRILTASTNNYVQERIIRAYDVTTRTATLYPNFETTLLPSGTVTYEIVPPLFNIFDDVIGIAIARRIAGIEGDKNRLTTNTQMYAEAMREHRLNAAAMQSIIDSRFETDTIFNPRSWLL